jgi:hypothetical protein
MVPIRKPKVALQHPSWGDVSVQLPVPKAPLCQRSPALCGDRLRTSSQRGYWDALEPPFRLGTAYFTRLTAAEDLPEIVTAMFDRLLPNGQIFKSGCGARGPSCRRNNEHRAENQPESHDLNHERPRENAGTVFPTRFFELRGNGLPR